MPLNLVSGKVLTHQKQVAFAKVSVLECVSLALESMEDGAKFMGATEAAMYEVRDMRKTLNLLYYLVK